MATEGYSLGNNYSTMDAMRTTSSVPVPGSLLSAPSIPTTRAQRSYDDLCQEAGVPLHIADEFFDLCNNGTELVGVLTQSQRPLTDLKRSIRDKKIVTGKFEIVEVDTSKRGGIQVANLPLPWNASEPFAVRITKAAYHWNKHYPHVNVEVPEDYQQEYYRAICPTDLQMAVFVYNNLVAPLEEDVLISATDNKTFILRRDLHTGEELFPPKEMSKSQLGNMLASLHMTLQGPKKMVTFKANDQLLKNRLRKKGVVIFEPHAFDAPPNLALDAEEEKRTGIKKIRTFSEARMGVPINVARLARDYDQHTNPIHRLFCLLFKNDNKVIEYVMFWLAFILQNRTRSEIVLVLTGGQGAGKGVFWNLVRCLIGQDYCGRVDNVNRILGDRTIQHKLVMFADEAGGSSSTHKNEQDLKKFASEAALKVTGDWQSPIEIQNHGNLLMASNERPGELSKHRTVGNRRFIVIDCGNGLILLIEVDRTALVEDCLKPENYIPFAKRLLATDLSKWDRTALLDVGTSLEHLLASPNNSPVAWMMDFLEKGNLYQEDGDLLFSFLLYNNELYDEPEDFLRPRLLKSKLYPSFRTFFIQFLGFARRELLSDAQWGRQLSSFWEVHNNSDNVRFVYLDTYAHCILKFRRVFNMPHAFTSRKALDTQRTAYEAVHQAVLVHMEDNPRSHWEPVSSPNFLNLPLDVQANMITSCTMEKKPKTISLPLTRSLDIGWSLGSAMEDVTPTVKKQEASAPPAGASSGIFESQPELPYAEEIGRKRLVQGLQVMMGVSPDTANNMISRFRVVTANDSSIRGDYAWIDGLSPQAFFQLVGRVSSASMVPPPLVMQPQTLRDVKMGSPTLEAMQAPSAVVEADEDAAMEDNVVPFTEEELAVLPHTIFLYLDQDRIIAHCDLDVWTPEHLYTNNVGQWNDSIRITHNNLELNSKRTLAASGVTHEASLHVVGNLRGAGEPGSDAQILPARPMQDLEERKEEVDASPAPQEWLAVTVMAPFFHEDLSFKKTDLGKLVKNLVQGFLLHRAYGLDHDVMVEWLSEGRYKVIRDNGEQLKLDQTLGQQHFFRDEHLMVVPEPERSVDAEACQKDEVRNAKRARPNTPPVAAVSQAQPMEDLEERKEESPPIRNPFDVPRLPRATRCSFFEHQCGFSLTERYPCRDWKLVNIDFIDELNKDVPTLNNEPFRADTTPICVLRGLKHEPEDVQILINGKDIKDIGKLGSVWWDLGVRDGAKIVIKGVGPRGGSGKVPQFTASNLKQPVFVEAQWGEYDYTLTSMNDDEKMEEARLGKVTFGSSSFHTMMFAQEGEVQVVGIGDAVDNVQIGQVNEFRFYEPTTGTYISDESISIVLRVRRVLTSREAAAVQAAIQRSWRKSLHFNVDTEDRIVYQQIDRACEALGWNLQQSNRPKKAKKVRSGRVAPRSEDKVTKKAVQTRKRANVVIERTANKQYIRRV